MPLCSRRDFLKTAALFPLATTLPVTSHAAIQPPQRTGDPQLKLSLNAYSFARLLNDRLQGRGEGLSLQQLAEFCAKQNFDGIDITAYYFPGYRERKLPDDKFVFEVKRRCFELGLGISGTGTGNNFTVADKEARSLCLGPGPEPAHGRIAVGVFWRRHIYGDPRESAVHEPVHEQPKANDPERRQNHEECHVERPQASHPSMTLHN